ncbi:MAG: TrkA family potassium uptake protein [Candidatus Krumholzibacteriota bacterium]
MLKVVVVGLGRFGSTLAVQLSREGAEVLAVDRSTKLVEAVAEDVTVAVGFDATDIANLKAYDVGAMDVGIVAIGKNFESSVLVTMHLKGLGVPVVYAKALNEMQESVLRRVGADQVVKPEEDLGTRLAHHLLHDSVVDFVELPDGFSLKRIRVPEDWNNQSLAELGLLGKLRLNLVQIRRSRPAAVEGEDPVSERIPLPDGSEVLRAGDEIDVIGPDGVLKNFD